MKCQAQELKLGDKLVNPDTGKHVSTIVEIDRGMFQIGNRDQYPEEERVILTVEFQDGKKITRDVSLGYVFEITRS